MKNLLFALLLLGTATAYGQHGGKSGQLVWYTDLMKAHEQSVATNKPIFGFFTGSDWCGWCHKLQKDVFDKPAFVKWAKNEVILLELDFPRRKKLSPELVQQNSGLQQAFKVQGYPTVWLFTMKKNDAAQMDIAALGSLGYPSGSAPGKEEVTFLAQANNILAQGKAKK